MGVFDSQGQSWAYGFSLGCPLCTEKAAGYKQAAQGVGGSSLNTQTAPDSTCTVSTCTANTCTASTCTVSAYTNYYH